MTSPDDAPTDSSGDDGAGGPPGPAGSDLPVDFDEAAAWRLIVENFGERARLDPVDPEPTNPTGRRSSDSPTDAPRDGRRAGSRAAEPPVLPPERVAPGTPLTPRPPAEDGVGAARHADEHFVPPEPPPLPKATPARRLAWIGLFATPLLMILAVVFDWTLPTWLSLGMVAAFVGGFVFLIATMPRDRSDDWDDGAVV